MAVSSASRAYCSCLLLLPPFFLVGTTRLELANQLIEGQPAFHFAFIPVVLTITTQHEQNQTPLML